MNNSLKKIFEKQFTFQKLVNFPIDSILEKDRNELSEKYIFKAIEELIELRKEHPSVMNPWAKIQPTADMDKITKELSDVFLFFTNILLTWKIDFKDFLKEVEKIQNVNFEKVKNTKLAKLNAEILQIPGYTSGIGSGSINPKYIMIGQNPGQRITHGYKCWSNPNDGSSKILLPLLKKYEVLDKFYFTNVVKCTTIDNTIPNSEMTKFWLPYLGKEIRILKVDNEDVKIITMGSFARDLLKSLKLQTHGHIKHPAVVFRNVNKDDYEKELKEVIENIN